MPSEQSKIHLIKKASYYSIFPSFTVIFYMPSKFGRVDELAPLMTFLKFKNQPSVLSPALLTMLTPNLSSKSCKSYPSLTSFRSTNSNSCKDLNQNFLPSSFNDTWVKNSIRNIGENDIQLGNFDQLRLTHANLTSLDLFTLYNFLKLWQDFPNQQIKIIRKPSEFDAKLKDFFLDDLASNIVCNRLFCPACMQATYGKSY